MNHRRSRRGYHSSTGLGTAALLLACTACSLLSGRPARIGPTPIAIAGAQPTGRWVDAKQVSLATINAARQQAGLQPLAWDPLLERTGDAFCMVLVREDGFGHVGTDGVTPYLRVLLAGDNGYHRQNVGSFDSSAEIRTTEVPDITRGLVVSMLAEKPPDDGHRQTILDPTATHIGIGLAVEGGRLRTSHEIVCHGASAWTAPPVSARPLEIVRLAGRLASPWRPAGAEVLWEPLPEPRPADAPPVRVYRYPHSRAIAFVRTPSPSLMNGRSPDQFDVDPAGTFTYSWRTGPAPGIELVVIWARRDLTETRLTPVAIAATVVTPDGTLPAGLRAWAELR